MRKFVFTAPALLPVSGSSRLTLPIRPQSSIANQPPVFSRSEAIAKLDALDQQVAQGQFQTALEGLNELKSTRQPLERVDLLRAIIFLNKGQPLEARQAVLEELRWFPGNHVARSYFQNLDARLGGFFELPPQVIQAEPIFALAYDALKDHSMLTKGRLLSLWLRARIALEQGVEGDFVECGTAGGGSGILLALAIRHMEKKEITAGGIAKKRSRKVHLCDTFTGMPDPTAKDVRSSDGVEAQATYWGSGTCSGPTNHIAQLVNSFGLEDTVVVHPGLFQDTLPGLKDQLMADYAFPSEATTATTSAATTSAGEQHAPRRSIALMHMDADWYDSTLTTFRELYPLVSKGGFIQLDDYEHWGGCRRAFGDFFEESHELGKQFLPSPVVEVVDGNAATWEKVQ